MIPHPILACPDCSSQTLSFESFQSKSGLYAAILIVLFIIGAPIIIRILGFQFERIQTKKIWWRATIPYVFFSAIWILLFVRDEKFRPNYNYADNIILFSDILAYIIYLPFMVIYNYFINPILFFSPSVAAIPIAILWLFFPPLIYGKLANKIDFQLKKKPDSGDTEQQHEHA